MAITLLRHAPLAKKYQKRFVGHSNIDIDLTLTDVSKLDEIKSRKYDLIYSSDLKRCTQTLDLIDFTYQADSRLREVMFKKEFELKNFEEIEKLDCFDNKYLDSKESWHKFICEESLNSFESRAISFLNDLPKNKETLICSHGGMIKVIYEQLLKKEIYKVDYLESIIIT